MGPGGCSPTSRTCGLKRFECGKSVQTSRVPADVTPDLLQSSWKSFFFNTAKGKPELARVTACEARLTQDSCSRRKE